MIDPQERAPGDRAEGSEIGPATGRLPQNTTHPHALDVSPVGMTGLYFVGLCECGAHVTLIPEDVTIGEVIGALEAVGFVLKVVAS